MMLPDYRCSMDIRLLLTSVSKADKQGQKYVSTNVLSYRTIAAKASRFGGLLKPGPSLKPPLQPDARFGRTYVFWREWAKLRDFVAVG